MLQCTQQHCAKKTQLVPEMCPGQKVCVELKGLAGRYFKSRAKKINDIFVYQFFSFPWKPEKKWSDFTQDGFL